MFLPDRLDRRRQNPGAISTTQLQTSRTESFKRLLLTSAKLTSSAKLTFPRGLFRPFSPWQDPHLDMGHGKTLSR